MFKRSKKNPIIKSDKKFSWRNKKVYNPTVYYDGKLYHLYYRAVARDGISSIGYGVSLDGENFNCSAKPTLKPRFEYEKFGNEDPRITKINKTFYLTFTVYDGQTARLALATSKNLKIWKKHGLIIKNWNLKKAQGFVIPWDIAQQNPVAAKVWLKAGGIFPEIITKKYWMIFGDRNLWLATSNDGLNWKPLLSPFIKPRKGFFDSVHVEMGPPPLRTEYGWLLLYHGINNKMVYRLGFLLLDLNNPSKILYRSSKPIFEPKAKYELTGIIDITRDQKPKVIFCCGAVIVGQELKIYYGAGDSYVCTATAKLSNLFKLLPKKLKNTRQTSTY